MYTEEQRKAARKRSLERYHVIRGKYFRLVIPHLQQYKGHPQELQTLKGDTLLALLRKQDTPSYSLQHYCISAQTHPTSGIPHLDILLIYDRSVLKSLRRFDYLIKPGHLTRYKNLNAAILQYGRKQDPKPLTNLPTDTSQILNLQQLKKDSYRYLQLEMLKDPLHFNLEQYCRSHDLAHHISNWSSIKVKLRDMQQAAANIMLKSRVGFKFIDRALIEELLTPEQVLKYDSWNGFQVIVDHLNHIPLYGPDRDPKSLNLLITGRTNCGKSSLVWHPFLTPRSPYNPLSSYCSVYPMGMKGWFPQYQSGVYQLIYWNQMKLTSYAYDVILQVLDGSPVMLPTKGSSHKKVDNPLVIMTSNMTLEQMIQQKFGYNKSYIQMARSNLGSRVENVIVPEGYNLFLLQKLLISVH